MELLEIINTLDNTSLERTITNVHSEETISYNTQRLNSFTVTINETTINNAYRICLRTISDTIHLYVTHATLSNYTKYELCDIEEVDVEC